MLLKEFLAREDVKDKKVSIGAENAFMYVGYVRDNLLEEAFKLQKDYVQAFIDEYNEKIDRLAFLRKRNPDFEHTPKYAHLKRYTKEQIKDMKRNIKHFLEYKKDLYLDRLDFIANYTSPLDREVLDFHYREWDDSWVVIVPGKEMLSFWFENEYQAYLKKVKESEK